MYYKLKIVYGWSLLVNVLTGDKSKFLIATVTSRWFLGEAKLESMTLKPNSANLTNV